MIAGPCLCGASDCPLCNPEGQIYITCTHCDKQIKQCFAETWTWDSDWKGYLCPECQKVLRLRCVYCKQAEVTHNLVDPNDTYWQCPQCDSTYAEEQYPRKVLE